MSQVVAGVKVVKRFEKWGILAKARPGVVSFSRGEFTPIFFAPLNRVEVEMNLITSFATNFNGVLKIYPSPRIVTRIDVGDTTIHFKRRTIKAYLFDPITQEVRLFPIPIPARTTHNFQFIASVGFRF